MSLILSSKHTVIERTAGELAATWYETGRSQGMTSKYKNARAYAKAYLESYIPLAIQILTSMLSRNDIPEIMKNEIYDSLLERSNDKGASNLVNLSQKRDSNYMPPPDWRPDDHIPDDKTVLHYLKTKKFN